MTPLLADFILMADSEPLPTLDGDPMAMEALLQDVFGIVVDEAIRKGTDASEKVGPFPFLLLLIKPSLLFSFLTLAQSFTPLMRLCPRFIVVPCISQELECCILTLFIYTVHLHFENMNCFKCRLGISFVC
jgi:hypothetical protein